MCLLFKHQSKRWQRWQTSIRDWRIIITRTDEKCEMNEITFVSYKSCAVAIVHWLDHSVITSDVHCSARSHTHNIFETEMMRRVPNVWRNATERNGATRFWTKSIGIYYLSSKRVRTKTDQNARRAERKRERVRERKIVIASLSLSPSALYSFAENSR